VNDIDEQRIAELLRRLPPAPEGWVEAAEALPRARAALDTLVAEAEADAERRRIVLTDLEAALEAAGVEPARPVVDELRRRLADR
jgi:hypothetical protein